MKNLNSLRIKLKVSVDGQDATEGTWLVVHPNSNLELERFIKNGNFDSGNRFKFIERTTEIENHRGVGLEDGLIRIEYKTEQKPIDVPRFNYYDVPCPRPWYPPYDRRRPRVPSPFPKYGRRSSDMGPDDVMRSVTSFSSSTSGLNSTVHTCNFMGATLSANECKIDATDSVLNDVGITVPGSVSNQHFEWTSDFLTQAIADVVVLKLRGCVGGQRVQHAVTVDHKPKCQTCGRVNKATNSYCATCGTALTVL